MLQVTLQKQLLKFRRQALKRGFRVLRDGCGGFSLIDVKVEPPRPLLGCDHQQLWVIEQLILTPLPEPPPRRKRMARLVEPAPAAEVMAPAEVEARQAHHLEASFRRLVDLLKARGGVL